MDKIKDSYEPWTSPCYCCWPADLCLGQANSVAIAWWYGKNTFIITFGGSGTLRCIGTLLRNSRWSAPLVEVDVASSWSAGSFLSASWPTRQRRRNSKRRGLVFKTKGGGPTHLILGYCSNICLDSGIQGGRFWSALHNLTVFFHEQQCELCTMDLPSPQRYDASQP